VQTHCGFGANSHAGFSGDGLLDFARDLIGMRIFHRIVSL
jgi:hypothetical protein